MRHRPQPTGRTLVAAFAAVAITFMAGIAVAQSYVWSIRSAAHDIASNSSTSVRLLSSMRSTVRTLEVLADDYVDACAAGSCGPVPPRLAEFRHALATDWSAHKQRATFPGEKEHWEAIDDELAHLDAAVERSLAHLERGDLRLAEADLNGEVKPSCDRLDGALAALTEFDYARGLNIASRIDTLAYRSMALSLILGAACLGLTALTAFFAIRSVKHYQRLLQQRADELDQFAGRMAHDVLSPLAGTMAAIHIAQDEASARGKATLERGRRGLERTRQLVEALLAFARAGAEPGKDASADVDAVLRDVADELHPLAKESQVALLVESSAPAHAACSAGVLMSVVGNITRNAIRYMGESDVRQVRLRKQIVDQGSVVRTEVEDTGPGIPTSLGERVFDPFVRGPSNEPGIGLGLATAKRLVTAHGGRVGFSSRPGRGTLFWFELPRARFASRSSPDARA